MVSYAYVSRLDLTIAVYIIRVYLSSAARESVDPTDANDRKIENERNLFEIAEVKPMTRGARGFFKPNLWIID